MDPPDPPWKLEYGPGPWYRGTKWGLLFPLTPVDGPPCGVCGESVSTHRAGTFFWRDDDDRLMAGSACFAEVDRIVEPFDDPVIRRAFFEDMRRLGRQGDVE